MKNIDKLAKLFTDRNNPQHINITTGEVISAFPLRIKWGDNIILERSQLIISSSILKEYSREVEVINAQMDQLNSNGSMDFHLEGSPPSQSYVITNINLPRSGVSKITGNIIFKDTLKVGDEVIMLPDNDFKMWYVLDKAVRA